MIKHFFLVAGLCALSAQALSEEFTVGQKDKKFTVAKLSVKVGDTVQFKNEDEVLHNVFSLSEIKSFDLGSYPKGEQKPVVFDKPGKVEVECALHPDMYLEIEVQP